jgi:ribosomal protein S12 methylthiotransferase
LPDPVPAEVAEERWHRFMQTQQRISAARLARKVGCELDVLVDAVEGTTAIARSYADAPEIDGVVRVKSARGVKPGDLIRVRITAADDYDLTAKPVKAAARDSS